MIALYKQAPKSSIVPGNFIAKTDVKAGSADIGSWDTIKEENVFFPSDNAKSSYKDDSERFDRFKTKVEDYFPNYTGVVGKGFYKNGNLQNESRNSNAILRKNRSRGIYAILNR